MYMSSTIHNPISNINTVSFYNYHLKVKYILHLFLYGGALLDYIARRPTSSGVLIENLIELNQNQHDLQYFWD